MSSQADVFEFSAYRFDKIKKELIFDYSISLKNGGILEFREKITLPLNLTISNIPEQLVNNVLQNLHLILGVNYWKLFCPKNIRIKLFTLNKDQAGFWNTVYTKGLGEFFYRNKIKNFKELVKFPYQLKNDFRPISYPRQNRSMVTVGGGKDSIVSLELLKLHTSQLSGFVVETNRSYPVINQVIEKAGINSLIIKREVDQKLFNVGKSRKIYKGHFPISAIYAFLGLLAAVFYDYRYFVVANEKSSDEANVNFEENSINHQWSKTSEFESLFQDYVRKYITPDVSYFSLLRPWYELRIMQEFTIYPKYWQTFSSCNRNFSLTKSSPANRWCGACPKCASVFLLLSPFVKKKELTQIFSKDLFSDKKLLPVYKQLLGLEGIKPFECVATIDESRLALYLTWLNKEYDHSSLIDLFKKEVLPGLKNIDTLKNKILTTGNLDKIPEPFKLILNKKVLILGYGKEGKTTEKYLKAKYSHLKIGIADKSLSSDYLEKQKDYELVIKTPGIPASKVKTSYTTATNIFFAEINNLVIGITGSKGKSTTASLIYQILKAAKRSVHLIGNIGNPSLESLIKLVNKEDVFVMEMSSYQLEDIKFSPQIAVITSLFPEHMDYHGNVDKYFLAKKNILRFQKPTDYFIYNPKFELLNRWAKESVSQAIPSISENKINPKTIKLVGEHNIDNIKVAVTVAKLFKVNDQTIHSAIQSFNPLPHRLEFVGEYSRIKFYDDAISTAPESTIAAIKALKNIGTIFLGGEDRGFDFRNLVDILISYKIANLVLFPASGDKIKSLLANYTGYKPKIFETENMEQAVKFAYENSPKHSVCLLSTASPSYSVWKNFEEKGNLFKKFVKKYSLL